MKKSETTSLTKLDQLIPIDSCWLVEHGYARHAQYVLGTISANVMDVGISDPDGRVPTMVMDGVAVISMSGPMTKKTTSVSEMFGGCSTIAVRRAVREAAKREDVTSILLLVDSPGGQASGTAELADDVAAAARKKPVVAYVEGMAASAAYWVASQASQIVASRASRVGSIGCYSVVYDESRAFENEGIAVHLLTTGDVKGAGALGTKVTDAHLAKFQAEVNAVSARFEADIVRGRGLDAQLVSGLADGSMWSAQDAIENGLIDAVADIDAAFDSLRSGTAVPAAHGATMETQTLLETGGGPKAAPPAIATDTPPEPNGQADDETKRSLAEAARQNAAMAEQIGANAARTLAEQALHSDKATSADVKALEELYFAAFKADGGGSVKLTDDMKNVVAGPVTSKVMAFVEAVPSRKITGEVLSDVGTDSVVIKSTTQEANDAEVRRRYFAATPNTAHLAERKEA